jgi:hypothetical protein
LPRTVIVPARPLCLLCGRAMNITESNRADIGLICFERQKLECPNCGGHDSRFAFLPEKAFSPRPASIVAEVQQSSSKRQVAEEVLQPKETEADPTNSDGPTLADNRAERPPPQIQFAEPQSVESQPVESQSVESQPVDPQSGESHFLESVGSKSLESQTVKPRDVSPAKNISGLIQSYMAKWRGP